MKAHIALLSIRPKANATIYFRASADPGSAEVDVYDSEDNVLEQPIVADANGLFSGVFGDTGFVWVHYADNAPYLLDLVSLSSSQPLATTDSPEFADVNITSLPAENTYWTSKAKSVKEFVVGLFMWVASVFLSWKDPTGWEDPDNISVTDNGDGTYTLTHPSGELKYRWRGIAKKLESPWVSPARPAGNGRFFLRSPDGNDPTWYTTVWVLHELQVIAVRVTDAYTISIRETHGLMPWLVHEEAHDRLGTYRKSGLGPTAGSYSLGTATDDAIRPSFDAGIAKDEDNNTPIAATPKGTYTTSRVGAGGVTTFDTASAYPFRSAGGYILINNPTLGTETPATQGKFVNVYERIIPVVLGTTSQLYRRTMVQPQAMYGSLEAAQSELVEGLLLGDLDLPTPEFFFYSRLTYATSASYATTGKVVLAGISYVAGGRASQVNITTGITPTAENIPCLPDGKLVATNTQQGLSDGANYHRGESDGVGVVPNTIVFDGGGAANLVHTDAKNTERASGAGALSLTVTGWQSGKRVVVELKAVGAPATLTINGEAQAEIATGKMVRYILEADDTDWWITVSAPVTPIAQPVQ